VEGRITSWLDGHVSRFVLMALAVLGICGTHGHVFALGRIRYQNPFEHTIGLRGAATLGLHSMDDAPAVFVEAGGRLLYGVSDLETTQIRVGVRRGAVGSLVSSIFLSSPVGHEYRVAIEPFMHRDQFGVSASLGYESLVLGDFATAMLTTVGVQAHVDLSKTLRLGYAMDGFRLHGEDYPGADTSVYVMARHMVSVIAHVRVDRDGRFEMSVASWVERGVLSVAAGYDEAPGLLKASFGLKGRHAAVALGASLHPFLGISKSVFVTWQR